MVTGEQQVEAQGCFNTVNGKHCCNATTIVATTVWFAQRFNTVNGKHCCNLFALLALKKLWKMPFQYRKR